MDKKSLTLEALDSWTNELVTQRFYLLRLRKDSKELEEKKSETVKRIREIKKYINQELDENGKLIQGIKEDESDIE